MQENIIHKMKSFLEDFTEIESYFSLRRFQECKRKLNELEKKNVESVNLKDQRNSFFWILRNNYLICDYLDMRENETLSMERFQSLLEGFHKIMKEWIYKSKNLSHIDFLLINNTLNFSCLCFLHGYEENIRNIDNITVAIISLRKVICMCNGISFIPPLNFAIGNPSHEIAVLLRDTLKCLKTVDPESRLLFVSNFILILQYLLIAESSPLYKRWTEALKLLGFMENDVLNFLDIKQDSYVSNRFGIWTSSEMKRENVKREINFNPKPFEESQKEINLLGKMPLFMFSIFGDVIMYQKDKNIFLVEKEMTYLLLFTVFSTCALHISNKEWKIPSFNDIDTSSDYVLKKAWCYLKGYLLFKGERVKEASEVMEMLNFSSFASHFKAKKAILTACILSKNNDHERALSILNCEAMNCEDCMPSTLYIISDEYEALGQKESQLQSLRLLFKLLRHKKEMETYSYCQYRIFLKTLDLIPVSTEVTMTKVLQKLASSLAHYELYDESAECFLDLLALLEVTGPANSIPHTIHNAAAALLLIGDSGGVDRSKEAATLCRRAAEILSQNCDIPEKKSSRESSSEYELSPSKRPRLEMHVGTVFMELELGTDEEDAMEIDNREEIENIFDPLSSLSVGVISSSLMSSGRDLTSFILLSECACREKDFRTCTLLLNRCLHILNNQQSIERSEKNMRKWFLDTTNFIMSHIFLRKAKILLKRESLEKKDFGNDIKFCFSNALKHNPDDAEIKYFYLKYMAESKKIKSQSLMELTKNLNFNNKAFSVSPPKENLAVWYLFKPTIANEEYETLLEDIRSAGK